MPRVKYGAEMVKKILAMKQKGYKYSEIAEEMKMNRKAVENLCTRYRLLAKTTNEESKKTMPKFPVDIKLDGEVVGTIRPMDVAPAPEPEVKPEKTIKDFSARELIKRLYELGYRIENNSLYCIIKKPVQLSEIINA